MTGPAILYSEDMQHGQVIDGALTIQSPFVPAARQRRGQYRVKAGRAAKKPGPCAIRAPYESIQATVSLDKCRGGQFNQVRAIRHR